MAIHELIDREKQRELQGLVYDLHQRLAQDPLPRWVLITMEPTLRMLQHLVDNMDGSLTPVRAPHDHGPGEHLKHPTRPRTPAESPTVEES